MKNIIICGASRAGKSTLAGVLRSKRGYNVFHVDMLREMYNFLRPADKINEMQYGKQEQILGDMVSAFIHEMDWHCNDNGERYILEGVALDLRRLVKECDPEKFVIVALGFCDIDPNEKLADMKKHETEKQWTYKFTDPEKLCFIKSGIEQSKRTKKIAEDLGVKYFDTSSDRDLTIAKAAKYLAK